MMFCKNDRLLFIGDSITDSERNKEALPARWQSWGEGYVQLINSYTTAFYPEKELMVINQGVSGNRVTDLKARWQSDVFDLKPDVVTVMIGVNDVGRHFDGVFYQEEQVTPEIFYQTLKELIAATIPVTKQVYLLSGFLLMEAKDDPMRKMLADYNALTKKIAEELNVVFVDVQAAMDDYLKVQAGYYLSIDRIHPSLVGHMIIAKAWLEAAGLGGKL
nr:SGNH hydrolase [Enterococcus diestrammenae]